MLIPQTLEPYTVHRAGAATTTEFNDVVPSMVEVDTIRVRAWPAGQTVVNRHGEQVLVETWKMIGNADADVERLDRLVGALGTLIVDSVYRPRVAGAVHHIQLVAYRAEQGALTPASEESE